MLSYKNIFLLSRYAIRGFSGLTHQGAKYPPWNKNNLRFTDELLIELGAFI